MLRENSSRYVISQPGQLSLAIPLWVGAISTNQCTVMLWGRRLGSKSRHGPCLLVDKNVHLVHRALEMCTIKHCINPRLLHYSSNNFGYVVHFTLICTSSTTIRDAFQRNAPAVYLLEFSSAHVLAPDSLCSSSYSGPAVGALFHSTYTRRFKKLLDEHYVRHILGFNRLLLRIFSVFAAYCNAYVSGKRAQACSLFARLYNNKTSMTTI